MRGENNFNDQESVDSLDAEELGREWPKRGYGPGEQPQVFLKRWRHRSTLRRLQLIEELFLSPIGPRRVERLELLLRNLEARKAWLEARFEHIVGLETIVRAALRRHTRNRRSRGNQALGNKVRQGGNERGTQP
jgi:hypothetical protein